MPVVVVEAMVVVMLVMVVEMVVMMASSSISSISHQEPNNVCVYNKVSDKTKSRWKKKRRKCAYIRDENAASREEFVP